MENDTSKSGGRDVEAAHTPGPWEICNLTDVFTTSGATNAAGRTADPNDGWQIADCAVGITSVDGEYEPLTSDEQQANAEFIVRAMSSHDDLLEACKAAKKYLEPDLVEPGRTVFWQLVAAIAKATGEEAESFEAAQQQMLELREAAEREEDEETPIPETEVCNACGRVLNIHGVCPTCGQVG